MFVGKPGIDPNKAQYHCSNEEESGQALPWLEGGGLEGWLDAHADTRRMKSIYIAQAVFTRLAA